MSEQLEVFFDGLCPLCKREMDMVKRMDRDNLLLLTDIASTEFVPADHSLEELMREIHARLPNGEYVKGVEVFRQIYQRIGFGFSVGASRLPGIRGLLNLGYKVFAWVRFKSAAHRMRESAICKNGKSCSINQNIHS